MELRHDTIVGTKAASYPVLQVSKWVEEALTPQSTKDLKCPIWLTVLEIGNYLRPRCGVVLLSPWVDLREKNKQKKAATSTIFSASLHMFPFLNMKKKIFQVLH